MGYLFTSVVGGREDVDRGADASFKDYVGSWLFRYNLAGFFLGTVYVVAFSAVAFAARTGGWMPVDTAYAWACVHLGLSTAGLVVGYLFSRRRLIFRVPWKSIIRYFGMSALMLAAMYPLYLMLPVSNTAAVQFVRVGAILMVGIVAYLGAVVLLDREGKEMVRLLISRLAS